MFGLGFFGNSRDLMGHLAPAACIGPANEFGLHSAGGLCAGAEYQLQKSHPFKHLFANLIASDLTDFIGRNDDDHSASN
jgi:hypothetical protein